MKTDQTREPAIDLGFLKGIIGNDPQFEKELFTIFAQNVDYNLRKMESAIVNNNNNSWYMAAHAFKGAAASIGAFVLAKMLEYAQKHPEEKAEEKTKLLQKVKEELDLVFEIIKDELMSM